MELNEYLISLIERATSGNCNDTDLLERSNETMDCKDVEKIVSAFWITMEEEFCMNEEDEKDFILKMTKNIIEIM